jgi:hypothetical protein
MSSVSNSVGHTGDFSCTAFTEWESWRCDVLALFTLIPRWLVYSALLFASGFAIGEDVAYRKAAREAHGQALLLHERSTRAVAFTPRPATAPATR